MKQKIKNDGADEVLMFYVLKPFYFSTSVRYRRSFQKMIHDERRKRENGGRKMQFLRKTDKFQNFNQVDRVEIQTARKRTNFSSFIQH